MEGGIPTNILQARKNDYANIPMAQSSNHTRQVVRKPSSQWQQQIDNKKLWYRYIQWANLPMAKSSKHGYGETSKQEKG